MALLCKNQHNTLATKWQGCQWQAGPFRLWPLLVGPAEGPKRSRIDVSCLSGVNYSARGANCSKHVLWTHFDKVRHTNPNMIAIEGRRFLLASWSPRSRRRWQSTQSDQRNIRWAERHRTELLVGPLQKCFLGRNGWSRWARGTNIIYPFLLGI